MAVGNGKSLSRKVWGFIFFNPQTLVVWGFFYYGGKYESGLAGRTG